MFAGACLLARRGRLDFESALVSLPKTPMATIDPAPKPNAAEAPIPFKKASNDAQI